MVSAEPERQRHRQSHDAAARLAPVLVLEQPLVEFAGGQARQVGAEVHAFRALVVGDALAGVGDDFGFQRGIGVDAFRYKPATGDGATCATVRCDMLCSSLARMVASSAAANDAEAAARRPRTTVFATWLRGMSLLLWFDVRGGPWRWHSSRRGRRCDWRGAP